MLKEDIFEDLKTAMKARDEVRVRTLRMVVAAIKNRLVDKKDLGDEDVIEILAKEAKLRKDAIDEFTKANREDLAQSEEEELGIIRDYLPEKLNEDELRTIILDAIEEQHINSASGLGLVMKMIMPKVKGRADGKIVNKMVRDLLSDL
ncbi:MAG TPA: GatB/YqeY domain-containing protein [Thermotogota bacterium]|nr:GatB/YqeY domain-containing protein [Thermotogota bacterium]HRW34704.1 GatB/YqeY domain-containing protein [Thermotogota bacterium]